MATPSQICDSCGATLELGDRFCIACGAPAPSLCVACGTPLRPGARFCAACGTPVAGALPPGPHRPTAAPQSPASVPPTGRPAASLPAEERRLVTAVFCDLADFTPLSEALDPEDVRDIQAQYFGAMAEQIERYGGIVEKYAGDAVLALFGAPVAHEDDAERAVLCALDIQEAVRPLLDTIRARWRLEPGVRIGINTGEVVSGAWNASGRQDVAVTGDAINTAARLQTSAQSGEIVAGAETVRLTRRRIRYGERRDVALKGKSALVPVWPVLGMNDDLDERWERSATPFVGRTREFLDLLDAWRRAEAGEGQLVTLVGEAGVGKSRLIAEVIDRVRFEGDVTVLRARCVSYGHHISLWPTAELLRSLLGIKEHEALPDIRARLEDAIARLFAGLDAATQQEALDVFGELFGLPSGSSPVAQAAPHVRRQALIRSLKHCLRMAAGRAPTIVILEDLHWIDEASEEVLTDVLADVPGSRILAIVTQRPGWTAPWSEWGWPERLTLRPLQQRDANQLAGAVLGGAALSPGLERYIADRAGGNPFFVEEMLHALQETGSLEEHNGTVILAPGAAERVPSTLTEILLARLDRLDAEVRSLAQIASVIGRSFAVKLLSQIDWREEGLIETGLMELQRAEIAFPRGGTDLEYVFKHASLRDVAYNTLVQKRRRELHLRTARAIATLYPVDEYVEMIAYHYARSDAPEAMEWLERAGDRAAAIYALDNAVAHYTEAHRRAVGAGAQDAVLARLDEKLGVALRTLGRNDEALEPLERASETYWRIGDAHSAGRVIARLGGASRLVPPEQDVERMERMIEHLSADGPSPALAELYNSISLLCWSLGRYEDTLLPADHAERIAREIGNDEILAVAMMQRGVALSHLGRTEEALHALEGAVPLLEGAGKLDELWRALILAGEFHKMLGDPGCCRDYTERAREVADRVGNKGMVLFALGNLVEVLIVLGDWRAARATTDEAVALVRSHSSNTARVVLSGIELYLADGRLDEAATELEAGIETARERKERYFEEIMEIALARVDLARGDAARAVTRLGPLAPQEDGELGLLLPVLSAAYLETGQMDRAEEVAREAVDHVRRTSRHLYLPLCLHAHARALAAVGQRDEALAALDEAIRSAEAMPYPYVEGEALRDRAEIYAGTGKYDAARRDLARALTLASQLGQGKEVERLIGLLASIGQAELPVGPPGP